jgi:hypothetical protein
MDSGRGAPPGGGGALPALTRPKTLHLGMLVQPYSNNRKGLTTADVARFLEEKYGVMGAFVRVHEKDVAGAIESGLAGALEALLMGQVVDPWGRGMQAIEVAFQAFILSREAERVGIPGTPTRAALMGVSHRFKHPYARRARRPSFRDTGLYVNSFRAWIS